MAPEDCVQVGPRTVLFPRGGARSLWFSRDADAVLVRASNAALMRYVLDVLGRMSVPVGGHPEARKNGREAGHGFFALAPLVGVAFERSSA
jgi:hypothetical protein